MIKLPTVSPSSFKLIGEIAGYASNLNSLLFLAVLVADWKGYIDVVDQVYRDDGFCVSNRESDSIWNQSHAYCFYADTFMSIVYWIICQTQRGKVPDRALVVMEENVVSMFGHGCAHLFIALNPFSSDASNMSVF